jgi:hypothetical protein
LTSVLVRCRDLRGAGPDDRLAVLGLKNHAKIGFDGGHRQGAMAGCPKNAQLRRRRDSGDALRSEPKPLIAKR